MPTCKVVHERGVFDVIIPGRSVQAASIIICGIAFEHAAFHAERGCHIQVICTSDTACREDCYPSAMKGTVGAEESTIDRDGYRDRTKDAPTGN